MGRYVGMWSRTAEPFDDLPAADRRAVEAEVERLQAFHAAPD